MHQELFDELKKDHQEVRSLVNRLLETSEGSRRHDILEELLKEILPHMVGEEQVVYPHLREDAQAWEDAQEGIREHQQAREVLDHLASTSPGDDRFPDRVRDLREKLEHHIQEEESKIFDDIRRLVDERDGQRLLDSFRKEKDLAKTRYPDLPIRPPSHPGLQV